MHRSHRWLIAVCIACLAAASHGCSSDEGEAEEVEVPRVGFDVWSHYTAAPDRIAKLLQPRSLPAQMFQPSLSDESTRVYEKLKTAAQVDPELFLTLVRDGMVDGVPQYDPRFGITREEYDLLMSGTHLRLKTTGDTVVKITEGSEGNYVLRGLPGLSEVIVDAALQTVSTPYGDVARPQEFEAASSGHLTGPLVGYRWQEPAVAGDLRRYRIHEITLAQSQVDGAVWFIAQIADTIENRLLVDYFVRFDGPRSPD